MRNKFYPILIFLLFSTYSCLWKKNNTLQQKSVYEIEIIKFMDLNQYPRSIDEKIFWDYPEEHASFRIRIDKSSKTFLEDIKEFKTTNADSFPDFKYALLIKKDKKIDTLYSDQSLKHWKYKVNGKNLNYYDENYSSFLRENYTFFSDCW